MWNKFFLFLCNLEEQDLTDKLERLGGREVVILDDYSGDNHKLGVLNKLTSKSKVSKIRVMGDHETTRYVKGVIIPTVDSLETWITNKTGFEQAVETDINKVTREDKLDKWQYCLDIEISPIETSPLRALMLKSIQLDDRFIEVKSDNLPQLKQQLKKKELIAFNAPFDQTQLAKSGFDVWSNDWIDVSLLAKLYNNRLAEEKKESLADLEHHFLGTLPTAASN